MNERIEQAKQEYIQAHANAKLAEEAMLKAENACAAANQAARNAHKNLYEIISQELGEIPNVYEIGF